MMLIYRIYFVVQNISVFSVTEKSHSVQLKDTVWFSFFWGGGLFESLFSFSINMNINTNVQV